MKTIRVPRYFYQDHYERDLPTPINHSKSKTYATIAADDPALPDLLSDAVYYAENMMDSEWSSAIGLARSAAATVKAIRAADNWTQETVIVSPPRRRSP